MALALTVAACGAACGDDSPTSPDDTVTFTAQLLPANETPPVTNAESSGSGSATIRFNLTRNTAGAVTAATANFQVSLTGFPDNTSLTMAHIHNNVAGQAGPIVIDTGLTPGQVSLGSGAGNFARDGIPVADLALVQNIITNPSQYYFNVHSSTNSGGMARGQLVKQ
ncbi:MAG TPA: CHRD domain-containing protein [Vicinamibacterales bacterium]|nr:CHRD domain-containing protein [Vicinamibacterales bacterium]